MPKADKNSFPGYPHLKAVTHSKRYGRMELVEVYKTSDGFLTGWAKIGTGKNAYTHSVFLGRDPKPITFNAFGAEFRIEPMDGGYRVLRDGVEIAGPSCVGAPAGFVSIPAAVRYVKHYAGAA